MASRLCCETSDVQHHPDRPLTQFDRILLRPPPRTTGCHISILVSKVRSLRGSQAGSTLLGSQTLLRARQIRSVRIAASSPSVDRGARTPRTLRRVSSQAESLNLDPPTGSLGAAVALTLDRSGRAVAAVLARGESLRHGLGGCQRSVFGTGIIRWRARDSAMRPVLS